MQIKVKPEQAKGWLEILIQQQYAVLIIGLLLGLIIGVILYAVLIKRGIAPSPRSKASIADDAVRKDLYAANAALREDLARTDAKMENLTSIIERLEKELEPWLKFKERQADAALNARRMDGG